MRSGSSSQLFHELDLIDQISFHWLLVHLKVIRFGPSTRLNKLSTPAKLDSFQTARYGALEAGCVRHAGPRPQATDRPHVSPPRVRDSPLSCLVILHHHH